LIGTSILTGGAAVDRGARLLDQSAVEDVLEMMVLRSL